MEQHVKRSFHIIRSTLIGGVIFLLPLMVLGFLVGQIAPYAYALFKAESENPHFDSPWAYAVAVAITVLGLLLLCMLAGLAAQVSIGRKLAGKFEKNLTLLFPRYAIFKDQLAGNLGGEYAAERLIPVTIPYLTGQRVGFEIERDNTRVVVYLPGSPDPWTGEFVLFPPTDVTRFEAPTADLLSCYEKLGRDVLALLPEIPAQAETT